MVKALLGILATGPTVLLIGVSIVPLVVPIPGVGVVVVGVVAMSPGNYY